MEWVAVADASLSVVIGIVLSTGAQLWKGFGKKLNRCSVSFQHYRCISLSAIAPTEKACAPKLSVVKSSMNSLCRLE